MDISNAPQYAFGYGLSYGSFSYADLVLDQSEINQNDTLKVSVNITNTGKYAGEEVVQMYLKDEVAQPIRPVKELKDFKKISLKAGETRMVNFYFYIEKSKLSFYNDDLQWITQPGDFKLMIGSASDD